jgi:hypothetical protein
MIILILFNTVVRTGKYVCTYSTYTQDCVHFYYSKSRSSSSPQDVSGPVPWPAVTPAAPTDDTEDMARLDTPLLSLSFEGCFVSLLFEGVCCCIEGWAAGDRNLGAAVIPISWKGSRSRE